MDRLQAALQAVRRTDEGGNPVRLGAKCLSVVIDYLREQGIPEEDLGPLAGLQSAAEPQQAARLQEFEERRSEGRQPSEALLARVSAVIDLLVKAGYDEGEAAQAIMRQLIAAGVAAPRSGGDARGWKRLLSWRAHLLHGFASDEAKEAYSRFVRQIEAIPPQERMRAVYGQHLWDRRRKTREA